jgi:hypothetical protein
VLRKLLKIALTLDGTDIFMWNTSAADNMSRIDEADVGSVVGCTIYYWLLNFNRKIYEWISSSNL